MTLNIGSLLQGGKYRIEKVLGQGGFGITYLAEQTMLERKVAIKEFFMKEFCERDETTSQVCIPSSGSKDLVQRFRDKFLKEARNIAKLKHPHIIQILDVFEENGTAYYVMEYAENGSLSALVADNKPLPEAQATRYILQVADALAYIHQRKMNHLDIKPSNIMLNEKDEAVLIDFGLSKQYDEVGQQTSTTPVGMSEGYAPMEQYKQGGVKEFSPETDIYALGATFFKLLTGVTPPGASDINEDGVPVDELKKNDVSQTAIDVITKAMEPRRKQRLHEVRKFVDSLCSSSARKTNSKDEETIFYTDTPDEETIINVGTTGIGQKTFTVNDVSFVMKYVEGGTFKMGSNDFNASDDEKPVHSVTLSSYYIGQTEVTQDLWQAVMRNNPSWFEEKNLPVEQVSWEDCQTFIQKLNQLTGQKFRLPTEAEWEYAARGGKYSKGYQYAGSNNLNNVAWYKDNSAYETHPVATKQSNELGLYDMSGNVWEWCQDTKKSYSSISSLDSSLDSFRVCRGGGWSNSPLNCRTTFRFDLHPSYRVYQVGLRLAL